MEVLEEKPLEEISKRLEEKWKRSTRNALGISKAQLL